MFFNGTYRKALAVNSAATSFATVGPTLTAPTVVTAAGYGLRCDYSRMRLVFYGTGDANDVFEVRVYGWDQYSTGAGQIYIPVPVAGFVCTMGAMAGPAGGDLTTTDLFVDTITAATIPIEPTLAADTTRQGSVLISSPANDLIGFVDMPLFGYGNFGFAWDQTTGTPTGFNALVKFY